MLKPCSYPAADPDQDIEQRRQLHHGADGGRYAVLSVSVGEGDGIGPFHALRVVLDPLRVVVIAEQFAILFV